MIVTIKLKPGADVRRLESDMTAADEDGDGDASDIEISLNVAQVGLAAALQGIRGKNCQCEGCMRATAVLLVAAQMLQRAFGPEAERMQ